MIPDDVRAMREEALAEIRTTPWYQRYLQTAVLANLRGPSNAFAQTRANELMRENNWPSPGPDTYRFAESGRVVPPADVHARLAAGTVSRETAMRMMDAAVDGVSGQNQGAGDGTAVTDRGQPEPAHVPVPAPPLGRLRCTYCNRRYANAYTLHQHIGMMHQAEHAHVRNERSRVDEARTPTRPLPADSFIPDLWSRSVLEQVQLGAMMADRLTRQYEALVPLPVSLTSQMNTQQSGYAISQMMTAADAASRPIREAVENHQVRLTCAVTCEPGPIPIMCAECVGVAFYMDRLHGQMCRFDHRQIIKLDGSSPRVTEQPRCGSCGITLDPRLIADQLSAYRAADQRTMQRMGVRLSDAMHRRLEQEMMSPLMMFTPGGVEEIRYVPESYVDVWTQVVARQFQLRALRVRRRSTRERFPSGIGTTPRQTEALQRWADRWGRKNHWLVGSVRTSIRFSVARLRDEMLVSFPVCRPPVELIGEFSRARIDETAARHGGYWRLPVRGGTRVEMPRHREVAA